MTTKTQNTCRTIPDDERPKYCVDGVTVIATNNKDALYSGGDYSRLTLRPKKNFGIVDDPEFVNCWEYGFKDEILKQLSHFIKEHALNGVLHILRIGFEKEPSINPIALLIILSNPGTTFPSDSEILKLLRNLDSALKEHWNKNSVFIDIAQVLPRSSNSSGGAYVPFNFPALYEKTWPPFLGSSLGAEGSTGTLSGYVQHAKTDVITGESKVTPYALTCHHCVLPAEHNSIDKKTELANKKVKVLSPSQQDTQDLIKTLQRQVNVFGQESDQTTLTRISNYDNHLGSVLAAGERVQDGNFYQDWALINLARELKKEEIQLLNQHQPLSGAAASSLFIPVGTRGFDDDFLAARLGHYGASPLLPTELGVLTRGSFYMKPPSRTGARWSGCQCNNIFSHEFAGDIIKEYGCLVASDIKTSVTQPGDSGSLILDLDGKPVGMIHGGQRVKHEEILVDLTLMTKIQDVFADIEGVMKWEPGSVSFCGN